MEIKDIIRQIMNLETEKKCVNLDSLQPCEIASLSVMDNILGLLSINEHINRIVDAAKLWAESLKKGRIVLIGAGTSGRLAIMESAEMFPTFGIGKGKVMGFIAGGRGSVFFSKEGAEDREQEGKKIVSRLKLNKNDLLVALSASGRTPYVKGAVSKARELGCKTVLISTNPEKKVIIKADINICINSGPEILPGSTRMKSATVQKVVLNTISLIGAVMAGRVYKGRMIKLQPTSHKLKARAINTLREEFNINDNEAYKILLACDWDLEKAFKILEKNANIGRKI